MSEITLWPVADAAEREATRSAAFYADRRFGGTSAVFNELVLSSELRDRADVVEAWAAAGDEIRELTLGRYNFAFVSALEEVGNIIAASNSPLDCGPYSFWPFERSGFCEQVTPEYFIGRLVVAFDRLVDGSVALRALLSGTRLMRPHPMPGLLNSTVPTRELSTFERKTLHMIGLRGGTIVWPDFEEVP